MTSRRVVVVRSAFGGVLGELADWLGSELHAAGYEASTCAAADAAGCDADLVVLLGAGPEFEGALRRGRPGRRTVLWAFDPLPPPSLAPAQIDEGVRRSRRAAELRRVERALPAGLGRPGALGPHRALARRLAVKALSIGNPMPTIEGLHPTDALFAFERLAWLEAAVERGDLDLVLVSSPASVQTLAARGIDASYRPVAPHPAMGRDLGCRRDLPVVFLGSTLDGRGPRLAQLGRDLAARGVPLTVVDRACFGEERTALLNRAGVVLNLHKFPWHLERIRLLLAVANGALFVSELPVPDPAPFAVGVDLVGAEPDALADAVVDHLEGEARRRMVASASEALAGLPSLGDVARELLVLA